MRSVLQELKEEWIELDEFPNYALSTFGEVHNIRTDFRKKPTRNQQGIAMTTMIGRDGLQKTKSLANLVACAFIPEDREIFNTPIHLDGDKMNCRVDNLMWRPRWFAVKYHKQFNYPDFYTASPHLVIVETGEEFYNMKDPCIKYGLLYTDVLRSYIEGREVFLTGQNFRSVS